MLNLYFKGDSPKQVRSEVEPDFLQDGGGPSPSGRPLEVAGVVDGAALAVPVDVLPAVPLAARSFGANQYWRVPGGFLVYNVLEESLDAHCSCDKHVNRKNPCRVNRTRLETRGSPEKGRPLGFLMAWLAAQGCRDSEFAHKSMAIPHRRRPEDLPFLLLARRQAGRTWLQDHGFHDLLGLERPKRDGEPDEPLGLV
jgi:hypothetical protein